MSGSEPSSSGASVSVLTFGCRLNHAESEAMRRAAEQAGQKNLLIVNTCAVTADAVRDAERAIRRAKRNDPDRRIVATGCAAEVERARLAAMPEIDELRPNMEKLGPAGWSAPGAAASLGHTRAFLDVQNGCDHRCTFCVIPFGRGPSRSRPLEDVVAQAQMLVAAGRQEIVLTGVDLTSWGLDLPGRPPLGRLVRSLLTRIPELRRLRLSSLDCAEADDELLDAFASEPRLMPHLHLSLQAGSDLILKRMKRRHLRGDAIALTRNLARLRPGVALGADLIVGFPTESEEMFKETLALVDECDLSFIHVFPYSARPGAPAARMPQVDPETIRDRAARLRTKGEEVKARRLRSQIGSTVRVLVERGDRGHAEDFATVLVPKGLQRGAIVELEVIGSNDRELIADHPATSRRLSDAPAYGLEEAPRL